MAKLKGPLLSEKAHGKLAQDLIYSSRKEGNIGRQYHYPKKEVTLKQWTQRHIIGLLTAHWQVKTDSEKKVYEDLAKASGLNISGFNYFIKVAQADLKTHHGLVGYWSFNESTGDQAYDYSGCGNHGTLKPTYPSDVPTRVDSFRKEYGNALKFDGVNDYVDCGNDESLVLTDAITIEAWGKPTALGQRYGIVEKHTSPDYGWWFAIEDTKALKFLVATSVGVRYSESTIDLTTDWTHVVGIYHGTDVKLFINGNDKSGTTEGTGGGDIINDDQTVCIGAARWGNYFFNGPMDEIRIYNRALGTDEIKKHFELLRLNKHRQPLLIH
jgi:hypothetical protein